MDELASLRESAREIALPRVVRPPLVKIERAEIMRIREALIEGGLLDKNARDTARISFWRKTSLRNRGSLV